MSMMGLAPSPGTSRSVMVNAQSQRSKRPAKAISLSLECCRPIRIVGHDLKLALICRQARLPPVAAQRRTSPADRQQHTTRKAPTDVDERQTAGGQVQVLVVL